MKDDKDYSAIDYAALAEFRYQIRRFLRFSEEAARNAGIEPQQYQLLLAIKGLPQDARARIGEIAERLQIHHHSTVELVDRMEGHGLVQRKRRSEDRREVLVTLTAKGERVLKELAIYHSDELRSTAPDLLASLRRIIARPTFKKSSSPKRPRGLSRGEGRVTIG